MIKYHQFNSITFILLALLMWSVSGLSQERKVRWKRSQSSKRVELQLFHSTQAINLPTAESLQRGDFEFEISHRSVPPITEGIDALYGLDGPGEYAPGVGICSHKPGDNYPGTQNFFKYEMNGCPR